MRSNSLLLSALLTSLVTVPWASAQQTQSVHMTSVGHFLQFDVPGAGTDSYQGTTGVMINPSGWVVGQFVDARYVTHGFLRSPFGTTIRFDAPGAGNVADSGQGTFPMSINPVGQITGSYTDANGMNHGFLRSPSGGFTTFDAGGEGTQTLPGNINPKGEIEGLLYDVDFYVHGFLRSPNGAITTFDAPYEGAFNTTSAFCTGLTPDGTVVGNYRSANRALHGFVRTHDGTFTSFDVPGAGTTKGLGTTVSSINFGGYICGSYKFTPNELHGYLRAPDGSITVFDAPGASFAGSAYGDAGTITSNINSEGTILGDFTDDNMVYHGYIRHFDGRFVVFDAPGAGTQPGQGTMPYVNNAFGMVTGTYMDENNVFHGFLWHR